MSPPVRRTFNIPAYADWESNSSWAQDYGGVNIDRYNGSGGAVFLPRIFIQDGLEWSGEPITVIGKEAFAGNKDVTSVSLPASVALIKENAFAGCSNLSEITLKSYWPPEVVEGAFDNVAPGAKVIVPANSTGYGAEGSLWNGLIVTHAQ